MNEGMNAHVIQARKETDGQGQEITAASSSLLASIREHKEQVGVKNSVTLVRERTIPTERPPPVGEVSASFCG